MHVIGVQQSRSITESCFPYMEMSRVLKLENKMAAILTANLGFQWKVFSEMERASSYIWKEKNIISLEMNAKGFQHFKRRH